MVFSRLDSFFVQIFLDEENALTESTLVGGTNLRALYVLQRDPFSAVSVVLKLSNLAIIVIFIDDT